MVLWIGVDDTDSRMGMCTTFLATELVRELSQDYDLIGYPRLVRLNPNIPWKTRGNGAICIRIGHGRGSPRVLGMLNGRDIRSFPRSAFDPPPSDVREAVTKTVVRWSRFEDPNTNPAFAILRTRPPSKLYWNAVRDVVPLPAALRMACGRGLVVRYKNGRGAIGALAATAWRPRDRTFEILAYRSKTRWGSPRDIDSSSVREMDQAFPSTFNNYDYENERVTVAPHSPCPILLGIRGDVPSDLPEAMAMIRCERPERWLIFETNQGTDDHVVRIRRFEPGHTVRFQGTVSASPVTLRGGHVVFAVDGQSVTAYEPSKQFRTITRRLLLGDQVEVVGAVRNQPATVNLEKLRVIGMVSKFRKVANPACPQCVKRMKSMGRGEEFRCRRCGLRLPRTAALTVRVPRPLALGWFEPPVGSRRHLSMPLKRLARLDLPRHATGWASNPSFRKRALPASAPWGHEAVPPASAECRAREFGIGPREPG